MKLLFESEIFVPTVSEAISTLTDRARVCVEDIEHDPSMGIVEISILRRQLTGFKKKLGGAQQPVYSQTMIKSLLRIWYVEEMKLEVHQRLAKDCNSCFTALFGLKIDGNKLYLGSVEEIQGNSLCQIFIRVNKLRIEICDETENVSQEILT